MVGKSAIESLNRLFDEAKQKAPKRIVIGENFMIPDLPMSLVDIATSSLTDEAKALLNFGFHSSIGAMELIFRRQRPGDQQNEQLNLELSGKISRVGTEIIVYQDQGENPSKVKFCPAREMALFRGDFLGAGEEDTFLTANDPKAKELFKQFDARPEEIQERDSLALIALARKIIGLSEDLT